MSKRDRKTTFDSSLVEYRRGRRDKQIRQRGQRGLTLSSDSEHDIVCSIRKEEKRRLRSRSISPLKRRHTSKGLPKKRRIQKERRILVNSSSGMPSKRENDTIAESKQSSHSLESAGRENGSLSPSKQKGKYKFVIGSTVPVHSATEKEFTSYLITVTYPNGDTKTILRRFRQFLALHSAVSKKFPHNAGLPHFPKKRFISNMSPSLVEKRRQKLEVYVQFVATLPGIEDFLAFQTFLGGDLRQRGLKKKKGKRNVPPVGRTASGGNLGGSEDDQTSFSDSEGETPDERERRLATEKRVNEVSSYLKGLDTNIERLKAIEKCFSCVFEKEDFVRFSDYSKIVVQIGKHLEEQETEPNFHAKEISEEDAAKIRNPKIRSIRQKITPAISELISKLRYLKFQLINVDTSEEELKELKGILDKTSEIFGAVNIIQESLGFRIETGTSHLSRDIWTDFIGENTRWYKDYFFEQEHINWMGLEEPAIGPILVSCKDEEDCYRLIVRTKDGNIKHIVNKDEFTFSGKDWSSNINEIVGKADSRLKNVDLFINSKPAMRKALLEYENKDMRITNRFKFGVVLCKKGQTKEEEMFSNVDGGSDYQEFLKLLGQKVKLKGFDKFSGGLDTKEGKTTGDYSVFTEWNNNEIMFHVATMLPHSTNSQQVHKKRHIGNDIIVIVFQEDGAPPFDPKAIKSNYIQIQIVVKVIKDSSKSATHYSVSVVSQADVPLFGPPLHYPAIMPHSIKFREWILEKLINGELSAYRSKLFIQQMRSTYKTLLSDFIENNQPDDKEWKKKIKSKSKKKKERGDG